MAEAVRPTSIKVGHMTYDIVWMTEKKYSKKHGTDSGGVTVVVANKIYIRLGEDGLEAHEDRLREVLVHEIFHTIWHMGSMSEHPEASKDDVEEWVVANFAPHLMTVMADNPDVVEYLWPGIVDQHEGSD